MALPQFFANIGLVPVNPNIGVQGQFHIQGELCQIVHIILAPNQTIQSEPGSMVYTADGMKQRVKLGGLGRLVSGESIFKSQYTNESGKPGYVGIAAAFPATIIPVDLNYTAGNILCKHDAFLAALDPNCTITVSPIRATSIGGCLCAGLPIFMQSIRASGTVFLAAHGTIMVKNLLPGEEFIVDTFAVVAMTNTVTVDVRSQGGCLVCCLGGAGVFNTVLRGPGTVWIQSMPMEKLRALFPQPGSKSKNNKNGINGVNIQI